MKKTNFIFFTIMVLCSINNLAFAENEKCYLLVEKSANFDPVVVQSTAFSIVNRYVEKVDLPPLGGLRPDACTYNVNLSETKDGFFISLAGPKINSIASSELAGMKGFTQALLRAVHKTFTTEDRKTQICLEYKSLLAGDCQIVEALVYVYDGNGHQIENGSTVRRGDQFYVMIKPLTALYAYVISKDSKSNLFKIFPNQQVTDIPNPLNANFQYFFPPQNSELIFEFDNNPGTEKLFFVFSATPLKEINSYFNGHTAPQGEDFEKRILARGINLSTKKKIMTIKLPNQKYQKKSVDELKGKGVLVKEVMLNHL
ncbi:MAG: DUF4384 domain-containing protein [SAR324 cluster bacterium]|nr:DUF4384 domain-containing protein [SAR324 cluster bacterium]